MPLTRIESLRLNQDPIITGIVQGHSNESFVSNVLLPEVSVNKATGKFPIFGNEALQVRQTERPLKQSKIKRLPVDDFTFDTFKCQEHALGIEIDHEELEVSSDILKLDSYYSGLVMDSLLLSQEYERCSLLQDPANYPTDNKQALSGNDCWDDPDSKPLEQIRDAIGTIRTKNIKKPNTLVLGLSSFQALQDHTSVLEKIKYTQKAIITEELISSLISTSDNQIQVVVGSGVYQDPTTLDFVDLWSDVAILAYVTQTARAQRSKYESTFGYTFTMNGYPWGGKETGEFGLVSTVGAFLKYDHKIVKPSAGFLFTNTRA